MNGNWNLKFGFVFKMNELTIKSLPELGNGVWRGFRRPVFPPALVVCNWEGAATKTSLFLRIGLDWIGLDWIGGVSQRPILVGGNLGFICAHSLFIAAIYLLSMASYDSCHKGTKLRQKRTNMYMLYPICVFIRFAYLKKTQRGYH